MWEIANHSRLPRVMRRVALLVMAAAIADLYLSAAGGFGLSQLWVGG